MVFAFYTKCTSFFLCQTIISSRIAVLSRNVMNRALRDTVSETFKWQFIQKNYHLSIYLIHFYYANILFILIMNFSWPFCCHYVCVWLFSGSSANLSPMVCGEYSVCRIFSAAVSCPMPDPVDENIVIF